MKPVIFAHIYTFSRRFHPKRLIKEEQKQFVKEDDLPLCFASTTKPYAILFLFDGCECVFVYIWLWNMQNKKLSSELLKRIAMQTFPPPFIFMLLEYCK